MFVNQTCTLFCDGFNVRWWASWLGAHVSMEQVFFKQERKFLLKKDIILLILSGKNLSEKWILNKWLNPGDFTSTRLSQAIFFLQSKLRKFYFKKIRGKSAYLGEKDGTLKIMKSQNNKDYFKRICASSRYGFGKSLWVHIRICRCSEENLELKRWKNIFFPNLNWKRAWTSLLVHYFFF